MTPLPPDGSRDHRIEDPTNLWIIHPAGRKLLPWFLARGISANAVSIGGLVVGLLAACAYFHWREWPFALLGLVLSVFWLIADGLDGMVARATNTASPLGRFLDGICDHVVFVAIYVALATSIGTREGWILACTAGAFHALQSNFFESERARYHRRCKGVAVSAQVPGRNPLVLGYDRLASLLERSAHAFDTRLQHERDPRPLARAYGSQAAAPMKLMSLMSANVRAWAIFVACIAGNPRFFWWFEIVPLTAVLALCLGWHRLVELRLSRISQLHPISKPSIDHF